MSKKIQGRPAKHGVYAFIKRGKLRDDIPGVDVIRRRVRNESAALLRLYGDDPPFLVLCKNQIYIDTIIELAIAEIGREGVLNKDALSKGEVRVRRVVQSLASFLNSSRLNIVALEKLRSSGSGDEVFDVVAYAEKRYPKKGDE